MSKVKDRERTAGVMVRDNPPAYVTGMRFGDINNEILIVDFVDVADGEASLSIFSSIALSPHTAKQLIDGLSSFVARNESAKAE